MPALLISDHSAIDSLYHCTELEPSTESSSSINKDNGKDTLKGAGTDSGEGFSIANIKRHNAVVQHVETAEMEAAPLPVQQELQDDIGKKRRLEFDVKEEDDVDVDANGVVNVNVSVNEGGDDDDKAACGMVSMPPTEGNDAWEDEPPMPAHKRFKIDI